VALEDRIRRAALDAIMDDNVWPPKDATHAT